MRQVVAKRLDARGHLWDKMITPGALDLLAETSGGVMRELIRYFRDAATSAQLLGQMQIDEAIAEDVVDEQRLQIAPQLNVDHRKALRLVLEQGALSGGTQEAIEDDLLRSLHLLSYQDEKNFWFDAHPNALPLLN